MHVVFLEVCVCSRQVEAVRMLEACWIVDEVVIMASSSKFCKDACMWNEPLVDNWMEGNAGVSNPQDTMYDTRVEEDAESSDWEGRGLQCCPFFWVWMGCELKMFLKWSSLHLRRLAASITITAD
ncbi:hypothetical protein AHAS_Ahas03G0107800 [Arachis hypogaea]